MIANQHPCARPDCGHDQTVHSDLVGCTHEDENRYCGCPQFQDAGQVESRVIIQMPPRHGKAASGRARRDEGIARIDAVDDDAAQDWRGKAHLALEVLAMTDGEFSADDLVDMIGEPPRPNMLGGLFMGAARRNLIRPVGFRQATRPSAHARIQRTWEGK